MVEGKRAAELWEFRKHLNWPACQEVLVRQVNARSRPGYLQHGKSLRVEGERSVTCAQDYTDDAAYLARSIG
jgi:hypothetical protein